MHQEHKHKYSSWKEVTVSRERADAMKAVAHKLGYVTAHVVAREGQHHHPRAMQRSSSNLPLEPGPVIHGPAVIVGKDQVILSLYARDLEPDKGLQPFYENVNEIQPQPTAVSAAQFRRSASA